MPNAYMFDAANRRDFANFYLFRKLFFSCFFSREIKAAVRIFSVPFPTSAESVRIEIQHNLKTQQKLDMSRKLKELYEHPFFHGIKTKDEAEALWKESQDPEAVNYNCCYVWFAMESKDRILTYIYQGFRHNPDNDFEPLTGQFFGLVDYDWNQHKHKNCKFVKTGTGKNRVHSEDFYLRDPLVKRNNPHDLSQLARAAVFENLNTCECSFRRITGLNSDCCDRILSEKINQLEIPQSEKNMLKKLTPLCHIGYGRTMYFKKDY